MKHVALIGAGGMLAGMLRQTAPTGCQFIEFDLPDFDLTNRDQVMTTLGAGGFDTIVDSPVFAGGEFSYWNSQAIGLITVKLTQKNSLVPSLRTSKTEGQPNFVNPGLLLLNLGYDAELTPKFKLVFNGNYLQFVNTSSVELFINQNDLANPIGLDLSGGAIYRPWLNNNVIFKASAAVFSPLSGWEDIYETADTRFAFLSELELRF